MGKNQTHKAMQRSRAPEDGAETGVPEEGVDASFHTAEWHAARLAALTTERMSWEDWKKVEKEKAAKEAMVAAEEESQMLEYRKQLDQDRNALLAKGRNNAHLRVQTKDKKAKSKKSKKDAKSKKRRKEKGSDSSGSESSEDGREKSKKSKSKSKKRRKEKKRKRASSSSSSEEEDRRKADTDGPMRLSDFLK